MKDQLLAAVAGWERQRSQLDDQIRVGHELLDLLDPLPAEMLATLVVTEANDLALGDEVVTLVGDLDKPAKPTKPKPAQVACPDCGLMCTPGTGLGVHRRRKHPDSAAKPVTLEPAPAPVVERPHIDPKPIVAGKIFICDECDDFDAPNIKSLQRHTWDAHQRARLSIDERRPVDAPTAVAS